MVRIYSKTQLVEMLGRGAENLPETLCVERRRDPIPEAAWRQALDRAVSGCEVQFDLREFPKHRFPTGELQFAKTGIVAAATASLWRGSLVLPDKQSIPVWVRVDIRVPSQRWRSVTPIQAGSRIAEGDVLQETGWFAGTPCQTVEDWNPTGLIARRSLKSGAILQRADARRPPAVQRGQTVDVESGGAARVRVSGVAEANAEIGQNVRVTSAWNGSRLTGRVTADGKVRVE
jgi:flagella basal body P-ring formation protein FlgA